MGKKRGTPTSPRSSKTNKTKRSPQHYKHEVRQGGNSIRIIQERRNRHACCYNPETRKGTGAVLFTLGIPSLIAGVIMTIVSVTDNDNENKYPKAFIAVGPILLVLAVIFFSVGILLHNTYARQALQDCFSLDNPTGFCRVRCPVLSQFLSPDDTIVINRAAIKALQSEPGKSVLKRNRLLSDPTLYGPTFENTETENNEVFEDENCNRRYSHSQVKRNPRGVHFSDGDVEQGKKKRTSSITSGSENGSLVSLKHCKIHPKNDDIWWTDEHKNNPLHIKHPKDEVLETTEL